MQDRKDERTRPHLLLTQAQMTERTILRTRATLDGTLTTDQQPPRLTLGPSASHITGSAVQKAMKTLCSPISPRGGEEPQEARCRDCKSTIRKEKNPVITNIGIGWSYAAKITDGPRRDTARGFDPRQAMQLPLCAKERTR